MKWLKYIYRTLFASKCGCYLGASKQLGSVRDCPVHGDAALKAKGL